MTSLEEYFTPVQSSSIDRTSASYRFPILNKCIRRPKLQPKMIRNLLARRYGSLHDFSKVVARWCDIAKATGVHVDTCRKAVKMYHERGNKFKLDRVRPINAPRVRVIPAEIEAQLASYETLKEMRFLSLPRRRELIMREYGVYFGKHALRRLYKRNGISFKQAKSKRRLEPAREQRYELERIAFARKLHGLQQTCADQIIYLDQTTFQIWPKPVKTWQLKDAPIAAPENYKFMSAVTLYGAVGECIQNGKFYMTAPATDIPSTKKFLV